MRFVAKSAVAKSEVERYILYYFSVGAKRFGRYYRCVAKPNVAKCEVDCRFCLHFLAKRSGLRLYVKDDRNWCPSAQIFGEFL